MVFNNKNMVENKNISVIMGISIDGILDYDILIGGAKSSNYASFIDKLSNTYMATTVYHDRASIHRSSLVTSVASKNNLEMNTLSAYSQDFNPIELLFHTLKISFRKALKLIPQNTTYSMVDVVDRCIQSLIGVPLNNYYEHTIKIINSLKPLEVV